MTKSEEIQMYLYNSEKDCIYSINDEDKIFYRD